MKAYGLIALLTPVKSRWIPFIGSLILATNLSGDMYKDMFSWTELDTSNK